MSSNVTAVSYGVNLSLPEVQQLRRSLAAAGLRIGAENTTGDGRFSVYSADCTLPDAVTAAGLAGLRRDIAALTAWTRRSCPPRCGRPRGSS